jgi:hypothetical protein
VKKTLKIFSYDAANGYAQHKNSPVRPNYEILIPDSKVECVEMVGVKSGIVFLMIDNFIVLISLDSGELIERSEAQKGLNWFDKANPGSFLNYSSGVLTEFKPKGIPNFAQNFLPEIAPKMKKLVFA